MSTLVTQSQTISPNTYRDSILTTKDTLRSIFLNVTLGKYYYGRIPDSSIHFRDKALQMGELYNSHSSKEYPDSVFRYLSNAHLVRSYLHILKGETNEAISSALRSIEGNKMINDTSSLIGGLSALGYIYFYTDNEYVWLQLKNSGTNILRTLKI